MYFNDVNIVYYIVVAILRPFCWGIRKLDEQKTSRLQKSFYKGNI